MGIRFLSVAQVLRIHLDQIERYGGDAALRDRGLLEFAVAMPAARFGDQYLHAYPHEMAAAYLFHLAKNHPFVDGNKRTALASALVFLRLNGVTFRFDDQKELERFVVAIASGAKEKSDAAVYFRAHIGPDEAS